jgi:hypothetical protein
MQQTSKMALVVSKGGQYDQGEDFSIFFSSTSTNNKYEPNIEYSFGYGLCDCRDSHNLY